MEYDLITLAVFLVVSGVILYAIDTVRELIESHHRSKVLQKLPPPPGPAVKYLVRRKLEADKQKSGNVLPFKKRGK